MLFRKPSHYCGVKTEYYKCNYKADNERNHKIQKCLQPFIMYIT